MRAGVRVEEHPVHFARGRVEVAGVYGLEDDPHPCCEFGELFGFGGADGWAGAAVGAQRVGDGVDLGLGGRGDEDGAAVVAVGQSVDQLDRGREHAEDMTIECHLTSHVIPS